MTDQADTTLDEYFAGSQEELDAMDNSEVDPTDLDAQLETYTVQLRATLDELLPKATAGKRKAVMDGAFQNATMPVIFDKYSINEARAKLASFVANVEKKSGKPDAKPQPAQPTAAAAPATPVTEPQPIPQGQVAPVANLDTLPEAPFSATVKIWHKVYGVEVLLTVRSTTVSDGIRRLDTMMDKLLGEKGAYQAQRTQIDAPSTANRRIGPNEPASAPKQGGNTAPVRSFDPDADNKPKATGEILHEKVCQIEKVMAQDGKVQINLYPVLPNGGEAQFPSFYLKSDADKEEVYKHIDVDAMQLAKRYNFPATVDYVLSTKLNRKGNPYHNMRAIHPE